MLALYTVSRKAYQGSALRTCESVSTFVRQVSDGINDSIFSGIGI